MLVRFTFDMELSPDADQDEISAALIAAAESLPGVLAAWDAAVA